MFSVLVFRLRSLRLLRVSGIVMRFFFSSRRRHTMSYGDWSSDVCSSDLVLSVAARFEVTSADIRAWNHLEKGEVLHRGQVLKILTVAGVPIADESSLDKPAGGKSTKRSEERRVGKEWRVRRRW